jgi:hypothetical protein
MLPASYVEENVELAYATTAYQAQGRTVDAAHALVAPTTTREGLYLSATRGREASRLCADTCFDPDRYTGHEGLTSPKDAHQVLDAVLANQGADLSAHETSLLFRQAGDEISAAAPRVQSLQVAHGVGAEATVPASSAMDL